MPMPAAPQLKPDPSDAETFGADCVWAARACQDEAFSGATSTPPIWTSRGECVSAACACQDDSCAGMTSTPPICAVPPGFAAAATGTATAAATPKGQTGHWVKCTSGKLQGAPNLSRQSCSSASAQGKIEYWRCPAPIEAGPNG